MLDYDDKKFLQIINSDHDFLSMIWCLYIHIRTCIHTYVATYACTCHGDNC